MCEVSGWVSWTAVPFWTRKGLLREARRFKTSTEMSPSAAPANLPSRSIYYMYISISISTLCPPSRNTAFLPVKRNIKTHWNYSERPQFGMDQKHKTAEGSTFSTCLKLSWLSCTPASLLLPRLRILPLAEVSGTSLFQNRNCSLFLSKYRLSIPFKYHFPNQRINFNDLIPVSLKPKGQSWKDKTPNTTVATRKLHRNLATLSAFLNFFDDVLFLRRSHKNWRTAVLSLWWATYSSLSCRSAGYVPRWVCAWKWCISDWRGAIILWSRPTQ